MVESAFKGWQKANASLLNTSGKIPNYKMVLSNIVEKAFSGLTSQDEVSEMMKFLIAIKT